MHVFPLLDGAAFLHARAPGSRWGYSGPDCHNHPRIGGGPVFGTGGERGARDGGVLRSRGDRHWRGFGPAHAGAGALCHRYRAGRSPMRAVWVMYSVSFMTRTAISLMSLFMVGALVLVPRI